MHPASASEIFDRAAATYDVAAFPFFTPFGEALVDFAGVTQGERVLDVGCGAGAALKPAAAAGAVATGIELSPAMAARAREAAPGADVVVGDATRLPFADGSFDVVLSSFTVFFMPDPTAALAEWQRVLAPGGRIAVATWGDADPRWAFEREARMQFLGQIDQATLRELGAGLALLNRFDDAEKVGGELRSAGLEAERIESHVIEFHYADEDAWWDFNWSHGSRVVLEALSEDAREGFRAKVYEAMQPMRAEQGFPRTYTALFATACASVASSSL